jgi:hypothetical protein
MITVIFARYDAALVFVAMAESMWGVRRDDCMMGDPRAKQDLDLWTAFCQSLHARITEAGPDNLTFQIEDEYLPLLCDVRDHCNEVADAEDEFEDVCRREDVRITQDGKEIANWDR